jgi:hypothetical protein
MPSPEETWLSRRAAAIYLARIGCPISYRQLETMAANQNEGRGPRFARTGWRTVRYRQSDLDDWAKKRMKWVE